MLPEISENPNKTMDLWKHYASCLHTTKTSDYGDYVGVELLSASYPHFCLRGAPQCLPLKISALDYITLNLFKPI